MNAQTRSQTLTPAWTAPPPPPPQQTQTPRATCVLRLRQATLPDIPKLTHWDNLPHIVAISGTDDPMDWKSCILANPPWRKILMAEVFNCPSPRARAVGAVVIIDPAEEDTGYWMPIDRNLRAIDIWIGEVDCLGRGIGTGMMECALEMCFGEGCDAVLVDPLTSNVRAHKFYRKMGFREVGVRWFGDDECLVHRINRCDYEQSNNS